MGFVLDDSSCSPVGEVSMDADRFARFCKALAHPVRVRIMAHLNAADHCICGQIVEALPLSQSTVSQHLKILKTSGLVQGIIDGPRTCYCLDRKALQEFYQMAGQLGRDLIHDER